MVTNDGRLKMTHHPPPGSTNISEVHSELTAGRLGLLASLPSSWLFGLASWETAGEPSGLPDPGRTTIKRFGGEAHGARTRHVNAPHMYSSDTPEMMGREHMISTGEVHSGTCGPASRVK